MELRGIDFGPCWDAPGVRGWMGEGYWFHKPCRLFFKGFDFTGSTRVAKTTTLKSRLYPHGNMPTKGEKNLWAPKELFPGCIWMDPFSARTFNSVALTGPGARKLFAAGLISKKELAPFQLSYMSVGSDMDDRIRQFKLFVGLFLDAYGRSPNKGQVGLQINVSCPNTGLDTGHLVHEALAMLNDAQEITSAGIPVIVKLNILAPVKEVVEIAGHPSCDALCVTNALPFDSEPDDPALKELFPRWDELYPDGSPLFYRDKKFGGGGYSGPELIHLVAAFIQACRAAGVKKPWNAGGGIRNGTDVERLVHKAGLVPGKDSVFFASAAMVRPWRVHEIVEAAHRCLK